LNESNTRPAREKQGALIVAIDLPTNLTHTTPSAMAGFCIAQSLISQLELHAPLLQQYQATDISTVLIDSCLRKY
jgi:hypothetical protein